MTPLSHKQVEATATPTIEKGTAVLLVAAYSRDRGDDVIQPGAFRSTIQAWVGSNKKVPLAWDHDTAEPSRLIGTVDPRSMKETRDGLLAEAHLDLDGSETAREAWRLVKSDSIGVSFGYLVTDKEDGEDGATLLKGIDLFEISLTAVPMNGDTRVVSWKSAASGPSTRSAADDDFEAIHRHYLKAQEQRRRDVELEQMIAEITAREAKAEKRDRPVQIKTFKV